MDPIFEPTCIGLYSAVAYKYYIMSYIMSYVFSIIKITGYRITLYDPYKKG